MSGIVGFYFYKKFLDKIWNVQFLSVNIALLYWVRCFGKVDDYNEERGLMVSYGRQLNYCYICASVLNCNGCCILVEKLSA